MIVARAPAVPVEVQISEITAPEELSQARAQRERFERNAAWLQQHAAEVYAANRGRHICIAGEELFAGGTPEEACRRARIAHPDDDGMFVEYVPVRNTASSHAD